MSCWVVPAVAAEYWGIPIAQVLDRVKTGSVPSKTEFGFMLVDVAPNSPRAETGFRLPAANPPTYVATPSDELTEEEEFALADAMAVADTGDEPEDAETLSEDELVIAGMAEEEEASGEAFDWREARKSASRQRRAPRARSLAA